MSNNYGEKRQNFGAALKSLNDMSQNVPSHDFKLLTYLHLKFQRESNHNRAKRTKFTVKKD